MTDTNDLLKRLSTVLPGLWVEMPYGYRMAIPGGTIEVTTPLGKFVVRVEANGECTQLTGYLPERLELVIKRALGDDLWASLSNPEIARQLRRQELWRAREKAFNALAAANEAFNNAEADLDRFDQANPPSP